MLTGLAQSGSKALGGSRFSLVNVLPGAILVTFIASLALAGAYGPGEASLANIGANLEGFPGGPPAAAVTLAFGTFLLGVLLQPFQVALVQLLEGYWGSQRSLAFAAEFGIEHHRRRKRTACIEESIRATSAADRSFSEVAAYARRQACAQRTMQRAEVMLDRYPGEDERILPTMLGNVMRSGEDSAGERYGLDSMTVYPRMYPSLSRPIDAAMSRQLDLIDTTSALCVTFVVAAAVSSPLVARLDLWSLIPVLMALVAVLAYRAALRAAEGHSVLFATAFDLHRFDMLSQLHYRLPVTPQEEFRFNKRLSAFLGGREPAKRMLPNEPYAHPVAKAEGQQPGQGTAAGTDPAGGS